MKMFRFLRRVFIILILLIIVFFIFRLVKPEATSRFVDKVKTIPTTISGRFHREKKPKLIINGDTTSTSSNFEINDNEYYDENYTDVIVDEDNNEEYEIINESDYESTDNKTANNENYEITNNWEMKDMSRLDELNRELDKIMASWNNQSGWEEINPNNNENLWEIISWLVNEDNAIQISEITWNALPSGFVIIDVEQPYEPETQNQTVTQTTTTNTSNNSTQNNTKPKNTNNSSSRRQEWDCWKWLSVQDCEEFYSIFWNMNIN